MSYAHNEFTLEPLLSESLQDYLARHGHKLGDGRPGTQKLVEFWREGPAWAKAVTDWRPRYERRQTFEETGAE